MKKLHGIWFGMIAFALLFSAVSFVSAESVEEREARLRSELAQVEQEIAANTAKLDQTRQQGASIERDIAILDAEIRGAKLKIQAHNIAIQRLGKDINTKEEVIGELDESINKGRESLAELIRQTNEVDDFSLIEVMLSNENLSDFFNDTESINAIKESLHLSFEEIRSNREANEEQKQVLTVQRESEADAKFSVEAEKAKIEEKEAEKQRILAINKSTEKTYEQLVAERKQKAAQIRAALFALRDTAAIPFGDALKFANQAADKTGVRPAFLLAILQQESNLGANVGTCNRPGDPLEKQWEAIMPGPNDNSWRDDQTTFKDIMSRLGLSPESVPLSCPWQGGWGGAMGPSQFIPTTWHAYEYRVASAIGVQVANPWMPEHAFMASALYLADLGAGGGNYTAERTAALKYYAGNNWNLPKNAFYGNQVMQRAITIQTTMIDPLEGI